MSKRFSIRPLFAFSAIATLLWCQVDYVGHHLAENAADGQLPVAHVHESAGGPGHSHLPVPAPTGEHDQYPDDDCDFSVALHSERLVAIPLSVDKAAQATIPSIRNLSALQRPAVGVAATHTFPPLLFKSPVDRRVLIRI